MQEYLRIKEMIQRLERSFRGSDSPAFWLLLQEMNTVVYHQHLRIAQLEKEIILSSISCASPAREK